jgi:hypothetical protein
VKAEVKACHVEIQCIWTCHAGLFPEPEVDLEGIPKLAPDPDDDDEEEEEIKSKEGLEEGDIIFVTQLLPEPEEIHASPNKWQKDTTKTLHPRHPLYPIISVTLKMYFPKNHLKLSHKKRNGTMP